MSRADALTRYQELPLPDTTEEHWRFTDLTGFDPDSFSHDGGLSPPGTVPGKGQSLGMLDLDVAGLATISALASLGHSTRLFATKKHLPYPSTDKEGAEAQSVLVLAFQQSSLKH